MADRAKHVGVTPVNNPLLSAAGSSFPFENFTSAAQLVPISQRGSSIVLSEDAGEVDSFLGQDALPPLPLPGVLPPELKKPSAVQLQPITFYNSQGLPTGGGGVDFIGPVGVNYKSSESSFLTRHKQFASRRRPTVPKQTISSPSPPVPSSLLPSLTSQSAQPSATLSEPTSSESHSNCPPPPPPSKASPLLQDPPFISQTLLLPPKSQSTPPSPTTQPHISTSVSQPSHLVSKSQPPTASPSPAHKSIASHTVSEALTHSKTDHLSPDNQSLSQTQADQQTTPKNKDYIKSLVAELISAPKQSDISHKKQAISTSYGDNFRSEIKSSADVPGASNSCILTSAQTDPFISSDRNKSPDPVIRSDNTDTVTKTRSSELLESVTPKSESYGQADHRLPHTVSLISPSTAEALLSLSVGKRLSLSEGKSENPSVEFSERESSPCAPGSSEVSLDKCDNSETRSPEVIGLQSINSSSSSFRNQSPLPETNFPAVPVSDNLITLTSQEVTSSQAYIPAVNEQNFYSESPLKKSTDQSLVEQVDIPSKLEITSDSQPPPSNLVPSDPTTDKPSSDLFDLNHSKEPLHSSDQSLLLEAESKKVVCPTTDPPQVKSLSPTFDSSEKESSGQSHFLSSSLHQQQDPQFTSQPPESESSFANYKSTQFHTQSSQSPETRLPTTLGQNSSNPPIPQHFPTTQPNQPSITQFPSLTRPEHLYPNQFISPLGQVDQQLVTTQPGPSPQNQYSTPTTGSNHLHTYQPDQAPPFQSQTPGVQGQSPLYITPTFHHNQTQYPLGQHPQGRVFTPTLTAKSSVPPSSQPSTSQPGQVNTLAQNQVPLFYANADQHSQPPSVQLGQNPPSQVYTPTPERQPPVSQYFTPTSQPLPSQFLTPLSHNQTNSANFYTPYTPSHQVQDIHSLNPGGQRNKTSSIQFLTPTPTSGQSTTNQQLIPPFKAIPPPPLNEHFQPNSVQPNYLAPVLPPKQFVPPPPTSSHFPPPPTATLFPPPPAQGQAPSPLPSQTPPPAAAALPPPPPKSNFTSTPHLNQYSLHGRSKSLRSPYISATQQPQRDYSVPDSAPPLPPVQSVPLLPPTGSVNQPVQFLVPSQSSSPSLSTVPLSPAATPPVYNSGPSPVGVSNSRLTPTTDLPSFVPVSLTSTAPPPPSNQGFVNPFSASGTPPSLVSQEQIQSVGSIPLHPPQSSIYPKSEQSVESSKTVPPSNQGHPVCSPYGELGSSPALPPPPPGVRDSTLSVGVQDYNSDFPNPLDPVRRVSLDSSTFPPSGIPQGPSKNYRLGKQRPRYAQVPDLAVSPLAHSPSVYSSNLSAESPSVPPPPPALETFSIYPPGVQNFGSPAEDYFDPSTYTTSNTFEGDSSFANLATQPGSAAASAPGGANSYQPVYCHWFFKKEVEAKVLWKPFSLIDSIALENAFNSGETNEDTVVPTDGSRYDVNISQRQRSAVFWEEKKPTEVRRCSWFYKGPLDSRYTPYEEGFAAKLEEEYKVCMDTNKWNKKIEYNGETVMLHGPVVMVHYSPTGSSDQLGVATDTSPVKPRVVKRGVDEFEIEEGEPAKVDHLLFLVHGIGSVCDLRFRDVVETVDDFRSLALQLTRSHFSTMVESGQANRVEVLPVSWHWKLHGEDTGIDRKLQSITLKSIPRLRNFTNDTLLDILFYTSPVYCQKIMDTVGNEMNRMYEIFLKRNPDFKGRVSLGGHSLGSLILFDLLYHQKVPKHSQSSPSIVMTGPEGHPPALSKDKEQNPEKVSPKAAAEGADEDPNEEEDDTFNDEAMAAAFARSSDRNRRASRVNYMMGPAGTGQPFISYPQLNFKPENFFALGSPIGMFVTVRGIETLGNNFYLPTCPGFFNIFHPFDPVAYRVESLIDPEVALNLNPVMIPHHKGRKRMHLELKETMARVGSDLKNKLVDSMKSTWNTMAQYTMFSRPEPNTMESQITKALETHLGPATVSAPVDIGTDSESEAGDPGADITLGCLNGGRRVDYVLQEAPLESFNEYLFALQSHVCYWESEDTMLLILTEIYSASNVSPDSALSRVERERSPIKLLSDQFLSSASPPKPQLFSALRFPSSTSLSSDGSGGGLGVTRSQSVPKSMGDPSAATLSTSSPGYLESLGQPPQLGMDPTAPIMETRNLAPPPTAGFVKQALQRK